MESRIGILMDTFSISGKDLAALLHIDSSLVSKWKSGKRAFRPNSVYTSQIIKHVMALDSNNQYAKIKLILSSEYAGIHNASENEIALFLKDWLISGNNKSGGASNTLDEIKNLKSISPLSFYSIAGNNGRRQVLQFFQKYAMSLNTTCDIWIYSTESKRWMYEDSAYHDELQSRYISLLEKGCRIRIIHAMSGSYESLAQSMLTWLPMHMTGRTQAYFIPRYKYEQLGYTYFLLKDHLAVYNWSPKMNQGDVNTYITHEKQMIKDIEVMMEEYFSESTLIFERYYYDMHDDYLNTMVSVLEDESKIFHWFVSIPLCILSEDSIKRALIKNGISADELELYAERLNLLAKLYKKSPNRFIVDLDMLKISLQKPEVVLNDMSFVCGKTITVPQKMYIEMFKESLKLMENEENFHICLTSSRSLRNLKNTEIVAKENSRIIFGCVYGERPKTLVTKELTVVTALYSYFDELWNSTPYISRNKEYVSNQISKQISEQEKRMNS